MCPADDSDPQRIEVELINPGSEIFAPRIGTRAYFSTYLLAHAKNSSKLAGEIEAAHSGRSAFNIEHRGHVLSAIISASCFLEALANELFQDAEDCHGLTGDGVLAPLNARTHRLMADFWKATNRGYERPLEKYAMLLSFADAPPMERGSNPYQDAALLIQVRNAVVHFRPESRYSDEPHIMEKRLRARFADNALMEGSGNPWWTSHALGHGCAEWAHLSAKAFADHVCRQLDIRPNYFRLAGAEAAL